VASAALVSRGAAAVGSTSVCDSGVLDEHAARTSTMQSVAVEAALVRMIEP
jgi:hypothetical protein